MLKITNVSGANLALDGGGNLGHNQSIVVNSMPRSLQPYRKFLRVEPFVMLRKAEEAKPAPKKSKKDDKESS